MTLFFKLLLPTLLFAAVSSPGHAVEPREIGTAVEIKNDVTAAETNAAKRRLSKQSPVREQEVLELVCESLSNEQIAERLVLSVRTVDHHVSAILGKLGVASRQLAAETAQRSGLVPVRAET